MSVSNSADLCTGYYFTSNTSEDIPDEGEVDSVDEGMYGTVAAQLGVELGRKIANGNFGHVFHGVLNNEMEVCIKFLKPQYSARDQETQIKNFQREVTLMRDLHHPNIMELVLASHCPLMCIVTKYMSGGNLFHLIHDNSFKNDLAFVKILRDIACAMSYLHACNPAVVHRDLTSPNVLIDKDLVAKVSDFGLAKTKHPDLAPSGQRGNLSWLAPETLHQSAFEKPSDVYSFGVILWEVTARQVPFAGCTRRELEERKRAGQIPGPVPDSIPKEFVQLMAVCLHVDPTNRPTFQQIYDGLHALISTFEQDNPQLVNDDN